MQAVALSTGAIPVATVVKAVSIVGFLELVGRGVRGIASRRGRHGESGGRGRWGRCAATGSGISLGES